MRTPHRTLVVFAANVRFDLSPYVARLLSHHLAHWSDRKSDGLHLTMLILGPVGTVLDPLFQILPQHVERPFSGAVDAKGRDGQGVCCRLALGNAGVMLNTGLAISASGSMFSPRMLFVVSVMVWFSDAADFAAR